jgi:hypothetical protein
MAEQENTWAAFLVVGLALVLVGIGPLEASAWFIQYAFVGTGLLLTGFGYYRARLASIFE